MNVFSRISIYLREKLKGELFSGIFGERAILKNFYQNSGRTKNLISVFPAESFFLNKRVKAPSFANRSPEFSYQVDDFCKILHATICIRPRSKDSPTDTGLKFFNINTYQFFVDKNFVK